jgi:hypothetical protein
METVSSGRFKDILICAEALAPFCLANAEATQQHAALSSRELLSHLLARSIADTPLDDVIGAIPDVAQSIQRIELTKEIIIGGLRKCVMRSAQGVCGNNTRPDAVNIRWQEVHDIVKNLTALDKHEPVRSLVMEMSLYATRQVFDVVRFSPPDQLPSALQRAFRVLQQWPAATFELTAALRAWLPTRLQQFLTRLTETSEPASPELPSAGSKDPPTGSGSSSRTQPWKRIVWWLDVLRSAVTSGLLESTQLNEICTQLEPQCWDEGIQVALAERMLSALPGMTGGQKVSGLGDHFSARQLAKELAVRPTLVRYMPSMRLILYNCPGDPGNPADSVVLS